MNKLKTIIVTAIIAIAAVFLYQYFNKKSKERERLASQTQLIQQQIENTSKLIVTQAHYAKVYNYENTKSYGWDAFKSQKTALIVSNARVQIGFDLKKMGYRVDAQLKTIFIDNIPEPEITIDPNVSYYKLDNGVINKFEARDLNKIKNRVTADIREKIKKDPIVTQSQDRLLSELSKIYSLSNALGWKLVYDGATIESRDNLETFLP